MITICWNSEEQKRAFREKHGITNEQSKEFEEAYRKEFWAGKENAMPEYVICAKCEHFGGQDPHCQCPDLPPDFIMGTTSRHYMRELNAMGDCRWYKAKESGDTGILDEQDFRKEMGE
jgi:hypothetical protein